MASTVTWTALSSFQTMIAGTTLSPTLKNMTSTSKVLGNPYDNTVGKDTLSEWDLIMTFPSAPTAGGYLSLYLMEAIDGTHYADGDSSIAPAQTAWVGDFLVRNVTSAQRMQLSGVRLPPTKFKPLLINNTSQGTSNTDGDNILSFVTYNPQVG